MNSPISPFLFLLLGNNCFLGHSETMKSWFGPMGKHHFGPLPLEVFPLCVFPFVGRKDVWISIVGIHYSKLEAEMFMYYKKRRKDSAEELC